MKARTRPDRKVHNPYRSTLGDLFGHFLPPVLQPLKEKPPPWRKGQPNGTQLAPATKFAEPRPACKCGRPAAFWGYKNGRMKFRSECSRCRAWRLEHKPTLMPPIALPHAARPRCAVAGCPNAISVKIRHGRDANYTHPTWVPADAVGCFMPSAFCNKHRVWAHRPVGVLIPPPLHPLHTKAVFRNGKDQWDSWRKKLRRGLGLPKFGVVGHSYSPEGERHYHVSVTGVGMKVTAWADLIATVAFWTARIPPSRRDNAPVINRTWPTYASMATAHGVSQALVVWIVWELRTGALAVRGMPIERIVCTGRDPRPFLYPVQHILDPETWTWTTASPTDQRKFAAQQWHPSLPVSDPPPLGGNRAFSARHRGLTKWMLKPPSPTATAKPLPASRQKSTSGSGPTATGPSSVIRYGNVFDKSKPTKTT